MRREVLILLTVSFLLSSCNSKEEEMKRKFKISYKKLMHDPNSFELVNFTVTKKSFSFSNENERFLDSVYSVNNNYNNYSRLHDSIVNVEKNNDTNFTYTRVLAKVRGNNALGVKVLSSHQILYSDLNEEVEVHSIDGKRVN